MAAFFPLGPGTCLMVSRSSVMDVLWCVSRSRLPTNCAVVHLGACGWQSLPVEPRRPLQGPDGSRVHPQLPRHSRQLSYRGGMAGAGFMPRGGTCRDPSLASSSFSPAKSIFKAPRARVAWSRPIPSPNSSSNPRQKEETRLDFVVTSFQNTLFFWPVPSHTKAVEKVPEPAPSQRRCGSPAATRWLPQTRHALFFSAQAWRAARQLSFC